MDYFQLALYLVAALVPSICFLYVRVVLFDKAPLYVKMIAGGVACLALNRWFFFVYFLATGVVPTGFNIGLLGLVGAFAFFLLANYSQVDELVDDGSERYRKYRLFAMAAPVVVWAFYVAIFINLGATDTRVIFAIICLVMSAADYFHLKHLMMPDDGSGMAKAMRAFNLLLLAYSALYLIMMLSYFVGVEGLFYALSATIIVISGLIIPCTVRGVSKWGA